MGKRLGALTGAVLSLVLVGPASAEAATFDVDSEPDVTHVGGCTAAANDCSLRDAVDAVNASADTDNAISIPAGDYPIAAGQLEVDPSNGETTTITGAGARSTVLDAGDASRVFAIEASDTTISGVTITGGSSTDVASGPGPQPGDGGGIILTPSGFVQTSLTLVDSTVSGNTAAVQGGGVAAPSFHTVAGDFAAPLTIVRSTISGNHLTGGSPPIAAIGGGINTFGDLTLTNSTVTGNTVDSPALVNMGGGVGAGIDPSSTGPPTAVEITNSTIADNTVTGAPTSSGGGFAIPSTSPSVILDVTNTIIHGNTVNGSQEECSGLVAPASANNLTGDSSCDFSDPGSVQGDPQLGPLADNGGPTDTMLPGEGPAIDGGTSNGCPGTDQRGTARPQRLACDIGAVEVPGADLAVALAAQPPKPKIGDKVTFTLTVTNLGPSRSTDVVLTGKLPAPAKRIIPPDDCVVSKFKNSPIPKRKVTCQVGALQPDATTSRVVKIKPIKQTRRPRATAQVTSPVFDPVAVNNVTKLKIGVAR